jgi:hypothetical protein
VLQGWDGCGEQREVRSKEKGMKVRRRGEEAGEGSRRESGALERRWGR